VIRCGSDGAPRGRLDLHPGLGEMVVAGDGAVFVADRAACGPVVGRTIGPAGVSLAISRQSSPPGEQVRCS